MSILRSFALLGVCVVLQSLMGCSAKDVTAPPTTLQPTPKNYLLTWSNQSPVAGSSVTITAQLVDANNAPLPIAGRVVSWRNAGDVGGVFTSPTSTTDVGGKVTVAYTTATKVGSHTILVSEADGISGTSDAVMTIAGPPAKYRLVVNAPVILAGNTVPVSAYLSDVNDNQVWVSGRVVTWTSSGTGGSFSAATSSTNNVGVVTVNFKSSSTGGVTVVTAIDNSGFKGSTIGIQTVAGAQGIVAQAVVVGLAHSCVLDIAGMASCWGSNEYGQLGNGFTIDFSVPVPVSGTLRFVSLAAGSSHTCGISNNGEAFCWGSNSAGQLGNGNNVISAVLNAIPVSGDLSFVALTAGTAHTCGIVAGGAAYCWGGNGSGQLGIGSTGGSQVPVAVKGGLKFVALSAGGDHTCGVVDSGRAYCWGDNQHGQLGIGSQIGTLIPTAVQGTLVFSSVLTSGGSHTCGATADGAAYCWGDNHYEQLGGSGSNSETPTRTSGAQRFTSLSAGFVHTCGLAASGVAYCWGSNRSGELGNGTVAETDTPIPVAGNLVFASIAAAGDEYFFYTESVGGNGHTCGVTVDRTVYCWGYNSHGELGGSSAIGSSAFNPTPVKVAGQR